MTDAKFCDLHPDEKTALQRNVTNMWNLTMEQRYTAQSGQDTITKTKEVTIAVCHKCAMEKIFSLAKANNAMMEWQSTWWGQGADGKRKMNKEKYAGDAI